MNVISRGLVLLVCLTVGLLAMFVQPPAAMAVSARIKDVASFYFVC
ncbi:MAG TPA: hypothetical protein VHL31_19585 [Geminicoccus sp.]|jgi:hypothetical protein|nr:hypothetical protein [Geminicoccus sp.]HEX2528489.1 hypothetical protein [Geminicoccus sp.]